MSRNKRRGSKRKNSAAEASAGLHGFSPEFMTRYVVKMIELERNGSTKAKRDDMSAAVEKGNALRMEEEHGVIEFRLINNSREYNNDRNIMAWLSQLRHLFNMQLPKMPVDYVTRFVFDPNHKNLVLLKRCEVIGGICFRPFPAQGFIEIVFCAILSVEQVKGYGTHLMNKIKDLLVQDKCYNILTFADKDATGYFSKQGFSSKLEVPEKMYHGFIKEYEGATLMGCQLHPQIRYTDFYPFIKNVRDFHNVIHTMQHSGKMYGGIEHIFNENSGEVLSLSDIPGLEVYDDGEELEKDYHMDRKIREILRKLKESEAAWPFQEPVDPNDVPEYYGFIKYPMDLKMITERSKSKYYIHERMFIADLCRLFRNCYMFNAQDTVYYACGYELNELALSLLEQHFPDSDLFPALPDGPPTYTA